MKKENMEAGIEELGNPDDSMFLGGKLTNWVKRERTEDEVVFGDKFRKYKDDIEGGIYSVFVMIL